MSTLAALFPIAFVDPPQVIQTNVTNIPGSGSSPLQVVANLGFKAASAIQFQDSTGDWIGVYQGTSGHEVLKTIIGGGITAIIPVVLTANSRISLRSMTASPITNGDISIIFLGYGWNGSGS